MAKHKPRKVDHGFGQCIKYMLFLGNLFFFLVGCTVFGLGVWILVENNYMSAIYGVKLMTIATWMVLVSGLAIMVVTFFGCCGAVRENKCMLMTYFITLALVVLTMVVGAILACVFRTKIQEEIQNEMRVTLQDYYGVELHLEYNRLITESWDKAQSELYCCSVLDQGWSTYQGSRWQEAQGGIEDVSKPFVPETCCVKDQYDKYVWLDKCQLWIEGPPGGPSNQVNTALYYRGCYDAGWEFVKEFSGVLIGLGFGIGIPLLSGVAFSFLLVGML